MLNLLNLKLKQFNKSTQTSYTYSYSSFARTCKSTVEKLQSFHCNLPLGVLY